VFLKVSSFIFGSHSSASPGYVRRYPRTNRDGNALFVISFAHKWVSFGGSLMNHVFLAWLLKYHSMFIKFHFNKHFPQLYGLKNYVMK
jgi:hypothetical protein